jgi:hypothetical protein
VVDDCIDNSNQHTVDIIGSDVDSSKDKSQPVTQSTFWLT